MAGRGLKKGLPDWAKVTILALVVFGGAMAVIITPEALRQPKVTISNLKFSINYHYGEWPPGSIHIPEQPGPCVSQTVTASFHLVNTGQADGLVGAALKVDAKLVADSRYLVKAENLVSDGHMAADLPDCIPAQYVPPGGFPACYPGCVGPVYALDVVITSVVKA